MPRKAQVEGAAQPAPTPKQKLKTVLEEFVEAHPDKWEEMRLWPAQSSFEEIVKN